jgi:hypothetical protein
MKMTIDIIMDRVREKEGPNQQIWQHLLSATGGRYRSIRAHSGGSTSSHLPTTSLRFSLREHIIHPKTIRNTNPGYRR